MNLRRRTIYNGLAIWRRITDAVSQLTNTTPPRPLHRLPGNFVPQSDRSRPLTRSGLLLKTDFFEIAAAG
jgi:hypothetical protein